jgi:hypothetical protein
LDSKTVSNTLMIAAALSVLLAALDARLGVVLSVATLVGFSIYYRRTGGRQ